VAEEQDEPDPVHATLPGVHLTYMAMQVKAYHTDKAVWTSRPTRTMK
jgi:hypothetical protein